MGQTATWSSIPGEGVMNGKVSRRIRRAAVATKTKAKRLKRMWNDCPSDRRSTLAGMFERRVEAGPPEWLNAPEQEQD